MLFHRYIILHNKSLPSPETENKDLRGLDGREVECQTKVVI